MMKGKLETASATGRKGPAFNEPDVPYERQMKPGVFFIEKDDVTQAQVRIGHLGTEVSDTPDYYALHVMNEVFGGGFASRLFSTVRSEKGLAYMRLRRRRIGLRASGRLPGRPFDQERQHGRVRGRL